MNQRTIAYLGFSLIVAGILLFGSIFLDNDPYRKMDNLSYCIGANVVGCVCGIIGWRNPFGKAAIFLGAALAAFFVYILFMALSGMVFRF